MYTWDFSPLNPGLLLDYHRPVLTTASKEYILGYTVSGTLRVGFVVRLWRYMLVYVYDHWQSCETGKSSSVGQSQMPEHEVAIIRSYEENGTQCEGCG